MRCLERARLRKEISDKVRLEPRNFLREMAPEVERVTGWTIPSTLIDNLKIKDTGFLARCVTWPILGTRFGGTILGLTLSKRSIIVGRAGIIAGLVDYAELDSITADHSKKIGLVDDVTQLLKMVYLHEFVHYVHLNIRPQDYLGLVGCLRVILPAFGEKGHREMQERAKEAVRKRIMAEVIAIGTTHMVLGDDDPTLHDGYMTGLAVESVLDRIDPRIIHRVEFILYLLMFAHPLAESFLLRVLHKYGIDAIRQVLEQPPSYNDLVWNPHKY